MHKGMVPRGWIACVQDVGVDHLAPEGRRSLHPWEREEASIPAWWMLLSHSVKCPRSRIHSTPAHAVGRDVEPRHAGIRGGRTPGRGRLLRRGMHAAASLTRKLQQAVQRSGLDVRSQLTALALAARDLLQENGEAGAGEMQEAKG